jgi:hypothetical protein
VGATGQRPVAGSGCCREHTTHRRTAHRRSAMAARRAVSQVAAGKKAVAAARRKGRMRSSGRGSRLAESNAREENRQPRTCLSCFLALALGPHKIYIHTYVSGPMASRTLFGGTARTPPPRAGPEFALSSCSKIGKSFFPVFVAGEFCISSDLNEGKNQHHVLVTTIMGQI